MPLDPSIALDVQPINPLQSLAQGSQVANSLLQARGQMQQQQANMATSQAIKGATDPTTGQVDYGKAMAAMAQGPAAYNLPQFAQSVNAQQIQQQQLQQAKISQALQQQTAFRTRLGGIMTNPAFGKSDISGPVIQSAVDSVNEGSLTPQQAAQELGNMPTDPQGQAQWLKAHYVSALSGEAQLKALLPQMSTINSGGQTNIVATDPMTGQPTVTGAIGNTLSPAEAAQRVPTFQGGQPGTVPLGSLGGAPGPGAGGTPNPAASPFGTGRYPGAGGMNPQQSNQGATPVPGQGGAFLPSGPPMGAEAAANATGAGAGNALVADQNFVNGSAGRVYQLQQGLAGLQNSSTGKGTDWINTVKSYLQTAGAPGIDPNKIASYDEANKYLTQYALNQANGFGATTDSKLATTLGGNASTSISNLAAQDVVKANIGLERMKQAQVNAFNTSGQPPQNYQQFSSQWNSTVDPRTFIWDQLDPTKRASIAAGMSPAQKTAFGNQYNYAVQQGWVPDPRSQ